MTFPSYVIVIVVYGKNGELDIRRTVDNKTTMLQGNKQTTL